MIGYKFNGDPLALDSFLDAIELLKDLCEVPNRATLRKFIMTRLEGKAREAIVNEPNSTDDIVRQLKESIKTEPSKVIEGRILALRAEKTSLTKFAERAEELADQFRRSLIVEGFSREKAKELAIDKTVEMCRKSAKNDSVRTVIISGKFSEPKEVIAKMIVEINNLKADRVSAQYTHKGNDNNNNRGGFNRGRGGSHRGNYDRNSNSNRQNGYNNHNGNRSNNNNYSGHSNGHRGGSNNHSNNNRGRGHWQNNNNNNRSNEQTIRLVTGNENRSGNSEQSQNQSQN